VFKLEVVNVWFDCFDGYFWGFGFNLLKNNVIICVYGFLS